MRFFRQHDDSPQTHRRRRFLRKSFFFIGASATLSTGTNSARTSQSAELDGGLGAAPPRMLSHASAVPYRTFDAHLHCPSDEIGNLVVLDRPQGIWQLYPVTKTFAEFASYLDRTGVQRGIINSVR